MNHSLTKVISIENRSAFLATRLEESLVGIGTRTVPLSRTIVRCRDVAARVLDEYAYIYEKPIQLKLASLAGNHRVLVLAVLGIS